MGKQILNLSSIQTNDIVKVTEVGKPSTYSIVKHCIRQGNLAKEWPHLSDKKKEEISTLDCKNLKMVEFNAAASEWTMTIPTKTDDVFTSLIDSSYQFTLHESSMEEVETFLNTQEAADLIAHMTKALEESAAISKSYRQRIGKTLKKLV